MRVLVTGAGGFLGRHAVRALAARGDVTVRALLRSAPEEEAAAVETAIGDLRVPATLPAALEGVDVVAHLAAVVSGDDEAHVASTVVGTENLLGAMAAAGVGRLVLVSSFVVYDWGRARGALTEASPTLEAVADLDRRDGYTVAKVLQERLARRAAQRGEVELAVLRPGFVWAAGHEPMAGIGPQAGPALLVLGPRRPLPLTYVENCAHAVALACVEQRALGQTVNVVDDEPVSAWRFARQVLPLAGVRARPVPVPSAAAATLPRAARGVSRLLFGPGGALPGILVPERFDARFKPLAFPASALAELRGGPAPFTFAQAVHRAYGRA